MAITIDGITYRNLQEQVLKNKEDIEALQAGGSSDLVEQVSELNQQMARTLKTPVSTPPQTELVAINSQGAQVNLTIGSGLSLDASGTTLRSEGGGGGGASWSVYEIPLTSPSEVFSFDNVTSADVGGNNPIFFSIFASSGYYSGVIVNNTAASQPPTISTPFFLPGANGLITCYIYSEDGTCSIKDASTGDAPTLSGDITAIKYWNL